jgi:hypothetical protein
MNKRADDGARDRATNKAKTLQHDVNLIMQVERDEEGLLAKLESIAAGYHDLAGLWESAGDLQMADQARQQEEQTLNLSGKLADLANLTAADAQKVLDEVKVALRSLPPASGS